MEFFLQDNSAKWGGGISVLPEGHKFPVKSGFYKIDHYLKKIFNRIMIQIKSMRVNIQAGDMVVFDSRLPHSATYPCSLQNLKKGEAGRLFGIPEEHEKYVIYWNCFKYSGRKRILTTSRNLSNSSERRS